MTQTQTPFSPIDELMDLTDGARYPVNVHIEAKAPGSLDAQKMRAAVNTALYQHPLARARKIDPEQRDKQLLWEITEDPGIDPLMVVEGGNEDGISLARNQFLSTQVPLHESPPLRVLLVRGDSGDHLILNVSHAAADGIGTLRFMRSILRAYNGEADDTGSIDPLLARDLDRIYSPSNQEEKTRRLKSFIASMKTQMSEPTGVTAAGEGDQIAYGCHHLTLEVEDVAQLNPKKYVEGTFNDLLVAAMHRTVEVWNNSHGDESALVRVLSPVNLRPREWWFEVFGNFAMSFTTNTDSEQRDDPESLLNSVVEQSRIAKEEDFAEAMLMGLGVNTRLPMWMKNIMFQGPNTVHTASATLTNAGRISEALSFGEDGDAVEVWMSPPAVMPDGIGLGVTNYNGKIHLSFRHSYELLDDQAVGEFSGMFHESLLWLSQ